MTECGGGGQRSRPSSQGLREGQWVWGKRVGRCVSCSSGGVWRDLNGLMSLGREGPQHVGEWGLIQVGDTQRPRKGLLILLSQSHFWLTSDGSISLPEHRPGLSLFLCMATQLGGRGSGPGAGFEGWCAAYWLLGFRTHFSTLSLAPSSMNHGQLRGDEGKRDSRREQVS